MDTQSLLLIGQGIHKGAFFRLFFQRTVAGTALHFLIIGILGDLAEPRFRLALSPEGADVQISLIKGLRGQLLRQILVAAQRQQKTADQRRILLKKLFKFFDGPSPLLLCFIY